jgi:uncharacterized protein
VPEGQAGGVPTSRAANAVAARRDPGVRRKPKTQREDPMQVRYFIIASSMVAAFAAGGAPVATAADAAASVKNRIVIQVSDADPKKWNLALNNARNVQDALGAENVEIEIVTYGPGIDMLKKDSAVGQRVGDARDRKVTIVACENTMQAQHLKYDDMLPTVGFVPGGVVEIMQKQQQGWSYLRP